MPLTTSTIHCPVPDCDWSPQVPTERDGRRVTRLSLESLRLIVRKHQADRHPEEP